MHAIINFQLLRLENLRFPSWVYLKWILGRSYLFRQLYRLKLAFSLFSNNRSHTPALFVNSSTCITKLITALAFHVITSLIFLNPKCTKGALLEFLAFNELLKVTFIILLFNLSSLIFHTRQICMISHSAL